MKTRGITETGNGSFQPNIYTGHFGGSIREPESNTTVDVRNVASCLEET